MEHKNIVRHLGFWDQKTKSAMAEETRFYLVMEYCPDGNLEEWIKDVRKEHKTIDPNVGGLIFDDTLFFNNYFLCEQEALAIVGQVCECFVYMHSNSIIHRDIKTENILLTDNKKFVKLCDFGFTKKADAYAVRYTFLF